MKMVVIAIILPVLAGLAYGQGEIVTQSIQYEQGGVTLEGFLAYDAGMEGIRPGVLVIHEWVGLNDYARERARQLAAMGYVAFALDMYGKGVLAKTGDEASKLSAPFYADRALMRDRARAGFDVLRQHGLTDTTRMAVIGFCFGGTAALELAMSGADLRAAVGFHAVLNFPDTKDLENVKGSILILQGGKDPYMPPKDLDAVWQAMEADSIPYQINIYGGAVHGFTNPESGNNPSAGVAYNPVAARRAWLEMQGFFDEVLR
jgi:dienelactone hydrolase